MQQSSRPQRVYILRGVQLRCVSGGLAARPSCLAGLRRGGSGRAGVDRCDRPTHSDADQARRQEMKWGGVVK